MNTDLAYHIKKVIYKNSQLLRDNNTKIKNFLNDKILFGGGKDLKIIYQDIKFKFTQINDEYYYILFSKDDLDCVSIIIDKERNVAEIHSIGNFKSCLIDSNTKVGSTLLKITIKIIKKYKTKFGINKIILTDNSLKKCGEKDIKLSHMLILLTGQTWYGKYGFRPINVNTYENDKILNKNYKKNQYIMNKITIKESNIIKFIKLTQNSKIIKATEIILEQNENMLLKDFLTNFLIEFDLNCKYFNLFYDELYDNLGLEKFYKLFFGLDI